MLKLYGSPEPTSGTLLQGFYWNAEVTGPEGAETGKWYDFVAQKLDTIEAAGVAAVWLPPPSKERHQDNMGYGPMDYHDVGEYRQWRQVGDPNDASDLKWERHAGVETRFGSRQQLEALTGALQQRGIVPVADIVVNHRQAQQVNGQGEYLRWGGEEHSIASGKMVWGRDTDDPPEIVHQSGGGRYRDDGETRFAPNLAHDNSAVRAQLCEWMAWLKDEIGFGGWRYDYVKGFGSGRVAEYNYQTKPRLSVGECWASTQEIYDFIDGSDAYHVGQRSQAFDFPLKYHLTDVFRGNKPFHQLGMWKGALTSVTGGWPAKAVTFLDNHDTVRDSSQRFPQDAKRLAQGYAFLLTHPGLPCIFWQHLFQHSPYVQDSICRLARLRSELGVTNESWADVIRWKNNSYAARIDSRVVVKIGDDWWNPGDGWHLREWGRGWAVWSL